MDNFSSKEKSIRSFNFTITNLTWTRIMQKIWRVFILWTNYRHNSNMVNVDCICIFKILVNVRFGLINLMFSQFMTMFGAISFFDQIIDTILIWSMWIVSAFVKFLFILSWNLSFFQFMKWFGAFSFFDQIIDTILIWSMWIVFVFSRFVIMLGWNLPFSQFVNEFGAFSVSQQIIDTILMWLIYGSTFSWFLFM